MNTCLTNIKTDILLEHCDDPSFGTTDNITPHSESTYQTPWVQDTEHLGFQIPDWLGVLWSNITKDLPKHAS